MVIETPLLPFLEWLLGPGWYQAGLFHWLPLTIILLAGGLGIGWLVAALRGGSTKAAQVAGRVFAVALVATVCGLLVLWLVDPGGPGFFGGSLLASIVHSLEKLLGIGWYHGALYFWLLVAATLTFVVLVVGWLMAAVIHGPRAALRRTDRVLAAGLLDLAMISPRRVYALSWLAIKESIGLRVVVFALFVMILMFGAWYLHPGSHRPAQLYLDVVVDWIPYLLVLMAAILSSMSLPGDIKKKTLHTVVTKPVRASEIVLGRILGFAVVGTTLLAIMGVASYFFVTRGLSHTHELTEADLKAAARIVADRSATDEGDARHVYTKSNGDGHQHRVTVGSSGNWELEANKGHTHGLTRAQSDGRTTYHVGPPQGQLVARMPIYGKLRFLDRGGRPAERGINVGDEWTYRSFIAGGTRAAAIWTFDGITQSNFPESEFPDGLPLEMSIEVFRTTKGDTDDPRGIPGIHGSISVRTTTNEIVQLELELQHATLQRDRYQLPDETPEQAAARQADPDRQQMIELYEYYHREMGRIRSRLDERRAALPPRIDVEPIFTAKDFTTDVHYVPRQLKDAGGKTLDLFKDLAPDGKLEVWLQCSEPGQNFGAAQPDVYFRAGEASFALNLAKGYLGVWMQMILVIGIGVMYSTFLSAPIAMMATLGTLIGGIFRQFMADLGAGAVLGGGPVESLIRLVQQQNVTSEMEPGLRTRVAEMVDGVLQYGLAAAAAVLPELGRFSFADYVAHGFNVSPNALVQSAVRAAALLVPLFVAGYFFLKTREVAK